MSEFDPIPLRENWVAGDGAAITALSDFVHERNRQVELHCRFDLDPIGDVCLRFFLHIDAAPAGTKVDMNRWHIGITELGQSFLADVTDYVTLEDNTLKFHVNQPGTFGAVWLERRPCEKIK